jgi:hypothetical protein
MVQDDKETIVLNLDTDLLFQLMLIAHQRDITLNALVELALLDFIKNYKKVDE